LKQSGHAGLLAFLWAVLSLTAAVFAVGWPLQFFEALKGAKIYLGRFNTLNVFV
jgi:hypothetical protein